MAELDGQVELIPSVPSEQRVKQILACDHSFLSFSEQLVGLQMMDTILFSGYIDFLDIVIQS